MMEDARNITACMHLHFIAKYVERMGDHVTSIAEQVIYLVTGELPDEEREKASYAYLDPEKLGPTEYRLLTTFMEKPGRVLSREQLLDRVWVSDIYVDTHKVDVRIGSLRTREAPGESCDLGL